MWNCRDSRDRTGRRLDCRCAEAARISRLQFRRRGDARERQAQAAARRGQAKEPGGEACGGAAGRGDRHRPHALGDAWQADRNQRPSARFPRLAVVHNGIIENFRALRQELAAKGYAFATETDSEIAAFVVEDELEKGKPPEEAVHAALGRLRGAFALVYLFEGEEDLLIGARQGAPLAIGYGDGEMYLGSDALALAPSRTGSPISTKATGSR